MNTTKTKINGLDVENITYKSPGNNLLKFVREAAATRGYGFVAGVPNEEVAAVITTATARLVANPEQIDYSVGGTRIGRGFQGWSLGETAVPNRHRKRSL